jgi:hypothetical protein
MGGSLRFELSPLQTQTLLKTKPPPRIRVEVVAAGSDTLGFALLDPLEFVKGVSERWVRIQNGRGEMRLSVVMHDISRSTIRHSTSKVGADMPVSLLQPAVSDSSESALSLSRNQAADRSRLPADVRLPAGIQRRLQMPLPKEKYEVSVAFEEYKGVSDLLRTLFPADHGSGDRKYWFSWILFGQTFHSAEFLQSVPSLKRIKDTIIIRCTPVELPEMIATCFPFQCCLCSDEQAIIAVATIDYTSDNIMDDVNTKPDGWTQSHWFDVVPTFGDESLMANLHCSIRIAVQVRAINGGVRKSPSTSTVERSASNVLEQPAVLRIPEGLEANYRHVDNDGEEQDYDDERFDEDENGADDVTSHPSAPESGISNTDQMFSTADAAATLPYNLPGSGLRHDSVAHSRTQNAATMDLDRDALSEDILRHFRISLKIHSVTNLRRPCPVQIQLRYPHFGTLLSFRTTRSKLLQPHVENVISGGELCCNFVKTRRDFHQITADHPLVISVKSATHMETVHLGDCVVDLNTVYQSPVLKYRDFLSGLTFESVAKYRDYRLRLIARRNAGEDISVPPIDPVKVYSFDGFLSVTPQDKDYERGFSSTVEGASLRVSVIIEEIGAVGPEVAVSVKKGYQMQHGAFYGAVDEEEQTVNDRPDSTKTLNPATSAGSSQPIENIAFAATNLSDMSPGQRAVFEKLIEDWRRWQKDTETSWREKLQNEEKLMRERLLRENAMHLSQVADDVRRGQEENAKLEIKLREKLTEVERKAMDLALHEDRNKKDLANKAEDLQLLQRRVREEAKIRVESETRRCSGLESTITSLRAQLDAMERRARESEQGFESYRQALRGSPEHVLREEVSRLKAQLGECRTEIERQRTQMAKAQLEEEHQKALVHRLALELKREREKTSIIARQDHEQLRLEFLAREERSVNIIHFSL